MDPASSRATAVVATVERFPLAVSARWRANRRVCACHARAAICGGDLVGKFGGAGGLAETVLVVPGQLDQQPAGASVPGLGEVAAVLLETGGVLGRGQPEVAHQLARGGEPAEVANLGEQPERGAGRDPAERTQPAERLCPRVGARDPLELPVDGGDLRVEGREMAEHVLKRRLRERITETLGGDPGPVADRPALPAPIDVPVTQQLLGDPMLGRSPGAPQIVAATHQVTQTLLLRRWRLHEHQLLGAVQAHQLLRVPAVSLDAVPGADGISNGAITSHGTPIRDSSRCS
jgi:hypothetical protein